MTRWIRPRRLPARGGSRVVWEKTLLASHPAKYTCMFTSMLDHSVGWVSRMSFCTLDVNSTSQRRVWIRGIRTKHVSQRCRLITSKYVESGHVTRSRIQSGCFRFASRPCCTLQLNRSCQTPEPCVCSADRAPALGSSKEHDRPLKSGLLWKPDRSAALPSFVCTLLWEATKVLCCDYAHRENPSLVWQWI